MNPEFLARVATDARLTPDAARVIFYLCTLGPAGEERDVKGEDLSIVLHGGEKPIRAAIKRAAHCGYLTERHGGRAGHKLTLTAEANAAPQGVDFSGDPEECRPRGSDSAKNAAPGGVIPRPSSPTDTSPPSPPVNAGVRVLPVDRNVAKLRDWLGEHADAVAVMLESARHPSTWASVVWGQFGATGTQQHAYKGLPPSRWPAVLANALMEFAGTGDPFNARRFGRFVQNAADHERNTDAGAERLATGTDGSGDHGRPRGEARAPLFDTSRFPKIEPE